jgi:hypothetical protein
MALLISNQGPDSYTTLGDVTGDRVVDCERVKVRSTGARVRSYAAEV